MHSRFRMKGVLLAALVAVLASAMVPSVASAGPEPGAKKKGFRLFARALGSMTINRVYCGLAAQGQICVDSTGSSTIGGGFWPKGTADQYVFNSGLQIAGIIADGPWANDTVGGFFFDPKGTTEHGEAVQPIYNAASSDDLNAWPEAACVPFGDESAELFHPLLQLDSTNPGDYSYKCRKSASQGDIWFMSWEGNTGLRGGRAHPLGIVVEQRGMGWNYPSGNQDIIYFIYTFYNVSTTDPTRYASHRASIRPILLQKANDLHLGAASLGVTLPAEGYSITNMFAAFGADMDVGAAASNFASVNLPFALGYTYDRAFGRTAGWTFDPSIFGPPFFAGAGFIGVKYLKSPDGPGAIQLFSNTVNSNSVAGIVGDAQNILQLYRYLSGTLGPATGDQPCNIGDPETTRICYVKSDTPADMRFFQSSTPLDLAPGASGSIVVAYIFAAPVAVAGCGLTSAACAVGPGDPLRPNDALRLATGANLIDSMTGYRGYVDGDLASPGGVTPPDTIVQQSEVRVVRGSLLAKALVAQQVFDNKFLLPFAPASVDFFLVPGDNQVTVLWKPTSSEVSGDPFFSVASRPRVPDPETGALVNNQLYDPNYRQFDVEGYRVYRGRVDAPNELQLLAQFDYSGTLLRDYTGIIQPTPNCAPELTIVTGCTTLVPNNKDGSTLQNFRSFDINGQIIQLNAGTGRIRLFDNSAYITAADTLATGGGAEGSCGPRSVCPELNNSGVPFVYTDNTARNNFRYFYSVTAFDVNSIESGPSSLESPRNTKAVRPVHRSSNYSSSGEFTSTALVGRGVTLDTSAPLPTIDQSGRFSDKFPPSNAWRLGLGAFVSELLAAPGSISARLDSVVLGNYYNNVRSRTFFSTGEGSEKVIFSVSMDASDELGATNSAAQFRAVPVDNGLADQFGGNNQYKLPGEIRLWTTGLDYLALWGRGCVNRELDPSTPAGDRPGFDPAKGCDYNGSRWFDGDNESFANPIRCNPPNNVAQNQTCFNTAGALTGVVNINQQQAYWTAPGLNGRVLTGIQAAAKRGADMKVYWGAAGKVDSVIDETHNVRVPGPFDSVIELNSQNVLDTIDLGYDRKVGASWGILNGSAVTGTQPDGNARLTNRDLACVQPIKTLSGSVALQFTCPAGNDDYLLSNTAVPAPIGFFGGLIWPPNAGAPPIQNAANNGFVMWIAGDFFTFEMAGGLPPAAGSVWTLRQYIGAISGGRGGQEAGVGEEGDYSFSNPEGWRQLTSVGSEIQGNYVSSNTIGAPTARDLRSVHTVPDPYYVTNTYEQTTDTKIIKFVNLPTKAIIRIYSSSGVLVNLLENPGPSCQNVDFDGKPNNPIGGECTWNVRNRNNQVVASGVYFYHIEANIGGGTARRVGRMTVVNFAQ